MNNKCPKCNGKISLFYLKQNCPPCGVDLLYYKLDESVMYPLIDEHLNKLFAGEVDDGNGDLLDALIFGAYREALPDLRMQYYDRQRILRRLLTRHNADRSSTASTLEGMRKEYESLTEEFNKASDMLDKYKEEDNENYA